MGVRIKESIERDKGYAFLFVCNTVLSVCWFAVCVAAAVVVGWLGSLLTDGVYTTVLISKVLQLLFLVFGGVAAILHFIFRTGKLVNEVRRNGFAGRRSEK